MLISTLVIFSGCGAAETVKMFQSQSPTRTNIEEANKHLSMLYIRVKGLEKQVRRTRMLPQKSGCSASGGWWKGWAHI